MPDAGKIKKISIRLSIVAAIALLLMLVTICSTEDVTVTRSRTDSGVSKVQDVQVKEIADKSTPIGMKKEYRFTLDHEIKHDNSLAFYTVHQYVTVFLDGEEVYSLKPSGQYRFTKTVGSNWVMIPLYEADADKEVCVEITPVYESFRNRKVEFLTGSELAIYKNYFFKNLPELLLGSMAIFVGLVFSCVAGYNMIRKKRGSGLVALGLFSVMMGLWRLTDTRFTPFLMEEKPVLLFYISILMLNLGMVPIIRWAEEYFMERGRRILDIYCGVTAVVCLMQLALQFAGVRDLREMLVITHGMIAVGLLLIVIIVLYEKQKYPAQEKLPLGGKLAYLIVAGIAADVLAFYIKGNSSGLIFSLFAFVLYIVIMGVATLYNYSDQELRLVEQERELAKKDRELAKTERELAEKEKRLTDSRIRVMMSQIRSHFIFNVLATISTYCKIDPKQADKALVCFSRYLRRNIRIIEEEGMVPFTTELEQLEDYIALEQMRFAENITFEKEIQTSSFYIPPLTVQPIVENAIKHGLVEHGKSGIVFLRTEQTKDGIEITVTDNGVGFMPEMLEKTESVGIRNVRYRLENMADGSMDITSEPGKGTTVIIRIPQEESEE